MRFHYLSAINVLTAHIVLDYKQIEMEVSCRQSHCNSNKCHPIVSCVYRLGDKLAFDKMFSDNAPVGVVVFGGEHYCTTEAPFLHKIDPETLETISKVCALRRGAKGPSLSGPVAIRMATAPEFPFTDGLKVLMNLVP